MTGQRQRPSLRRPSIDDADRTLIALLTENGRLSNRALAAKVGLTEPTVGARLRSLADRRVLGVTASLDWVAAGYSRDAWLQICVEGRSPRDVSAELAGLDAVHIASVVLGSFDVLAHLLTTDDSEAASIIDEHIGRIVGVRSVHANVTLETTKFETKHARIPVRADAVRLPKPHVELDATDRALIELLVRDGRRSNRQAARDLGVSEGTVRLRLGRMESSGLLRITARSDPYLTGEVNSWAAVGVDVEKGCAHEVAQILAAVPEVIIVALVAGAHDLLLAVAARSRQRLIELIIDEIRAAPGVRAASTWEIVHTSVLRSQWARLLPATPDGDQREQLHAVR